MSETAQRGLTLADKFEEVGKILDRHGRDKSRLIPILQEVQEVYRYLPKEIMNYVAEQLDIPAGKVYGVATFYAQFALSPKGVYNVSVCLGTACYVKGSGDLFNKLSETLGIGSDECTEDGKFSLTACRCIGACGLAPVLTVNDDVYGRLTVDDIPGILAKYAD